MIRYALPVAALCAPALVHAQAAPSAGYKKAMSEGKKRLKKKDAAGAAEKFDEALSLQADDAEALYWRGAAALLAKEYASAADYSQRALNQATAPLLLAQAALQLGQSLEAQGRYLDAHAAYQAALMYNPKDKAATKALAAVAVAAWHERTLRFAPLRPTAAGKPGRCTALLAAAPSKSECRELSLAPKPEDARAAGLSGALIASVALPRDGVEFPQEERLSLLLETSTGWAAVPLLSLTSEEGYSSEALLAVQSATLAHPAGGLPVLFLVYEVEHRSRSFAPPRGQRVAGKWVERRTHLQMCALTQKKEPHCTGLVPLGVDATFTPSLTADDVDNLTVLPGIEAWKGAPYQEDPSQEGTWILSRGALGYELSGDTLTLRTKEGMIGASKTPPPDLSSWAGSYTLTFPE